MSIEAMKLALWHEAMAREPNRNQAKREKHEATSKFIREALAKQEQDEPVAVVTGVYGGRFTYAPIKASVILPVGMALYTKPQQRKPLTDEQKDIINFLLGASDIDDVWFGDKHPTEKGQFWWRNRLRKEFQEAAHDIKE